MSQTTPAATIAAVRAARRAMSDRLMAWSIASAIAGAAMIAASSWAESAGARAFWGAFGSQHLIWGVIDLCFAAVGARQARRADRLAADDPRAAAELDEAAQVRRVLRFNGKLNWLWLAIGAALLAGGAALGGDVSLIGHGLGVLVQGGFLFAFDRAFLARLGAALGQAR